jgi:PAS domain S-box-containing protein
MMQLLSPGKHSHENNPTAVSAFFFPAIRIMNQLTYPRKFLLVGCLFALPFGVVFFLLVNEINDRMDFSKKEAAGNKLLKPLRLTLEDLQRDRGMKYALRNDVAFVSQNDLERSKADIQRDMDKATAVEEEIRSTVPEISRWARFAEDWKARSKNEASLTSEEGFKEDTHNIANLLKVINDVADRSNLILDPDLDSYYLMDSVVTRLPALTEQIAQARGWGTAVVSRKTVKPQDSFFLSSLAGVIVEAREGILYDFDVIFRENPSLRPRLQALLDQSIETTDVFLQLLKEKILSVNEIGIQPKKYWETASAAITETFQLYDAASTALDEVLQKRIDKLSKKKTFILFITLAMVLIVIYLVVAFYLGTMRMIAALEEVSKRLAAGQADERLLLPDMHDEMSRVVQSFSNLAARLHSEIELSTKVAARFSGILDISGEAIISIDSCQKIIIFNKQAEIIFGFTASEVLGKPIDILIPERFLKTHADHVNKFASSGVQTRMMSKRGEIFGLRKNGEEFPAAASISQTITGGELVMTAIVQDITEHKKMEDELIRERDYSEKIINTTPVIVCGLDPNGVTNYINSTGEKLTGYSLPELLGRSWWDIFYPGHEYVQVEKLYQHLKTGDVRDYEMTLTTKSGEKKIISWSSAKQFNREGKLTEILGFGNDVTEKKRAERRLAAQYAVTAVLAESTNLDEAIQKIIRAICENLDWQVGAVWNVDAKADILRCADIWHKQFDSMKEFIDVTRHVTFKRNIGLPGRIWESRKSAWILDVVKDSNFPRAPFASKAGLHSAFGFPILFEDQFIGVMEFFTSEIRNPDEDLLSMMAAIGIQIGQFIRQKQLDLQLLQSQKMETVGTLAGGIAHDLNNQLTPVQGYIDLLLQETSPEHPNYQILMEAGQSAARCSEAIQRLTAFSRPTSQKKTIILLSGMFYEFKPVIQKFLPSTIQVEFNCEKDIWPIEANETELQTVLMNLCVNARDAMPQGGRLTIEAGNIDLSVKPVGGGRGQHVLISVTDTGSGMPPEVVKRVFEPFFTTKEKGKGTGLGLAMVFKIIQDHQGWVDVASKIGQGTAFHIYLPATPGATVFSVKAQTGIPEHLSAKNETILIADDEEAVRNLGKIFLERLGYKVLVACDGEEAAKLYEESHEKIDALMLDMTMPKMTGVQTIKKILEINPKAKILAVSGYTSEGTPQELIRLGVADFIQKPYTIVALAQIMRKAIGTK